MDKRIDRVFVYMMANRPRGVIYTGLSTELLSRALTHKTKLIKSFTNKYNCDLLVYYEIHTDIEQAAQRERLLKKWRRQWKIDLIEQQNPQWYDLFEDLMNKAG